MNLALLLALTFTKPAVVIQGGIVYDGTGKPPVRADIRIEGDTIRQIGKVRVLDTDRVVDANGLTVAPGFIDAHSHADGGIFEDRNAETQIRQGITTAVVGQDGGSQFPLKDWWQKLRVKPASINFASFVGHGTVRKQVIGDEPRKSTLEEQRKMASLVAQEMRSGALGLSSGLEYQPGRYADTAELIALAKAAKPYGGLYVSHMRNEDNLFFESAEELIDVGKGANIPAHINHIKLGSSRIWSRAPEVLKLMAANNVTADVYPYLYWQSTIRVIIPTEQFDDRKQWEQGLKDIGGAQNILLTRYSPDPSWEGKTIAQIAWQTGKDTIALIQEIIRKVHQDGKDESESVVVTAMSEQDLKTFIASPNVSFCSDGGLHGSHPRGAGSFPKILGEYVREKKVIPLEEALRKMTSLTASRFGIPGRGRIAPGMKADLVVFDPARVKDTATTKDPQAKAVGIETVLVNGVPVLLNGQITGAHPGQPLPKR